VRAHDSGKLTLKTSTASNNPDEAGTGEDLRKTVQLDQPKPSRIRTPAGKKTQK
jgi:hypothetical protein